MKFVRTHRFRFTVDYTDRPRRPMSKALPDLPYEELEDDFYQAPYGSADRPRVPLIVLAQQQQNDLSPSESDSGSNMGRPRSHLTTITERTEHTEASRHWPSKQQLVSMNDPRPISTGSSFTSYGQVIGEIYFLASRVDTLVLYTLHAL